LRRHRLTNQNGFSRYSQFGILFLKKHIYALGGRPVVYQADAEYYMLPDQMRWRHVKLDLENDPTVDFTWEREWRLPLNILPFAPSEVAVILPNRSFMVRLDAEIREDSYMEAYSWVPVLGEIACLYDEGNPWSLRTVGNETHQH
jgi:hypothetical protein